jgi:Kef-type K+ transport system membrane component KefB
MLGYALIPAIVVGSLLASHTLLGMPIVRELGMSRLEPMIVTVGATVLSDTLSLVVFAICVPAFEGDLTILALGVKIAEIVAFVLLILFGLSAMGLYALEKVADEDAHFVLIFAIMAATGVLARLVDLPDIVGAGAAVGNSSCVGARSATVT